MIKEIYKNNFAKKVSKDYLIVRFKEVKLIPYFFFLNNISYYAVKNYSGNYIIFRNFTAVIEADWFIYDSFNLKKKITDRVLKQVINNYKFLIINSLIYD